MNLSDNVMWPGWETVRLIGRGGFGAVYEIQRTIFGDTEQAALKVISIPQNESDIDELYSEGYDSETVTSTFQAYLQSIVAEYSLMRKLNGSAHIVSCDDVRYVQHDDGIGWDIFIKMELLTALPKALPAQISEDTVLKIARDMCAALELCNEYKIVHRDIKPQNIFVSKHGDYKLGDFGIAKTVEKTMGGTKIGTYKYMAPEVYNNQPYGATADIYSLGLVLYWLLNEKRMPFLPLPPEKLRVGMEENARNRRLAGEKLPEPAHGSAWLKRIVMKACAYDPKDRYQTAREMRQDLMAEGRTAAAFVAAASTFAAPSVVDQDEPTALLDEQTMLLSESEDEQTALLVEEAAEEQTALLVEEAAEEQTALLAEEPVKPQPVYQPKPVALQTVFCMKCGARNSANKCYCSNCNASLDDAPAEATHKETTAKAEERPAAAPKAAQPQAKRRRGYVLLACMAILAVAAFFCALNLCANRVVMANIMLASKNPTIRESVKDANDFLMEVFEMDRSDDGLICNRWGQCLNPGFGVSSTAKAIYILTSSVGMLILPFLITGLSVAESLRQPTENKQRRKYILWGILLVIFLIVWCSMMGAYADMIVTGNIMLASENPAIRESVRDVNDFFIDVFGMSRSAHGLICNRWGQCLNPGLGVSSTANAIKFILQAVTAQALPVIICGIYSWFVFRKDGFMKRKHSKQQISDMAER